MSVNTQNVYLVYEPGKRNPSVGLLLLFNPDGTANIVTSNGAGGFNFLISVPVSGRSSGSVNPDDASRGYARPAIKVE